MVVFRFFFFGLGMYNYTSKAYADEGYKDIDKFDTPFNVGLFHVGLKAGYQYFFMSIVGARGYLVMILMVVECL